MAVFLHILSLAALLAQASPAQASAPPADTLAAADTAAVPVRAGTVALPSVHVEAARLRTSALASTARVTALGRGAIENAAARDVGDLLAARSGAFVKRYGAGGLATVSLRGTGAAQTLVLLDGQRATDPQTGQVDLSLLPTVVLESVAVEHGAASARYGSGSLGGTVRLQTLAPTERLQAKATGSVGAFGMESAGLVGGGGAGRLAGLVAVEASRADGDFPYVNPARLSRPTERRTGAGRTQRTLFGRARYEAGRERLGLTAWLSDVERGLPGTADGSPRSARQWDRHLRLLARSETRLPWGTLEVDGSGQWSRLRYANSASQPALRIDDTTQAQAYAADATAHVPFSERLFLSGGFSGGLDRSTLRGGVRQLRGAAFADGTLALGRLRLQPALRLDLYGTEGRSLTALSPRLGASVRPLAWGGLRLKASVARAFRAPSFNERFYQPGGNPDLAPEDGWSADAGVALAVERPRYGFEAEASFFASRVEDQVAWAPSLVGAGVQVWRPGNVARVVTRGVELSARGRAEVWPRLQMDGGFFFTHTQAENRANPASKAYGQQLPYVPRQQLKAYAGAAWRGWRLDLSGRLVGPRFLTADASQRLPPYGVVDAHLRYARDVGPARLGLGLRVQNALDARYAVIRFYPMPPRHAEVRLTVQTRR